MAKILKPLSVWLFYLWFLIVVALRLENRISWYWFLVFVPIFLLDMIMWGQYVSIAVFNLRKILRGEWVFVSPTRYLGALFYLTTKMAFQILLCLKLDFGLMSMYWVLSPLYVMLPVLITDIFIELCRPSGTWD